MPNRRSGFNLIGEAEFLRFDLRQMNPDRWQCGSRHEVHAKHPTDWLNVAGYTTLALTCSRNEEQTGQSLDGAIEELLKLFPLNIYPRYRRQTGATIGFAGEVGVSDDEICRAWVQAHWDELTGEGPYGAELHPAVRLRMALSAEKAAYETNVHDAMLFHDVSIVMLTDADHLDELQDDGELTNDPERKPGDGDPQAS